jgi:radical SAM family protein
MLVTAPHLLENHAVLLASRGCVEDAWRLVEDGLTHGLLAPAAATRVACLIGDFPAAQLPPDHQVYGIFHDSIISSLHMAPVMHREYAREAFRQAVRWCEIETSSQCNRRCPYCPNSGVDRQKSNNFLDFGIYSKLVSELAEIAYDGTVNFVGNNEFFLHRENRRYVELAHRALPRAVFKLYSNGDYVTPDDIAWAASAGVRLLHVTLHSAPNKGYDDSEAMRRLLLFQRQAGIQLQLLDFQRERQLQFGTKCGNMTLFVKAQDMAQLGHNWNGLVQFGSRAARTVADPCSYPIRQFIVSHDADLLMCCIAFKERTEENICSGTLLGNLAEFPSIFEAYTSPQMLARRLEAFSTDHKYGPCGTCPGFDIQEAQAAALAKYVRTELAKCPA